MKDTIPIKTKEEILLIQEGGRKLSRIKEALFNMVEEGVSAYDVDKKADDLIKKLGGYPSFKMVPGYRWSTCVNVNEGVVHGIPGKDIIFRNGDLVSVDVGLFYKGFHTDTSFSKVVGEGTRFLYDFLDAGEKALKEAAGKCYPGNRIYDISKAIENSLKRRKFRPTAYLTGHGVGKSLHEEPLIPGVVGLVDRDDTPEIKEGMVFALEVIYLSGEDRLVTGDDGWTISTADGKIAGLFEDTFIVTPKGPLLVT